MNVKTNDAITFYGPNLSMSVSCLAYPASFYLCTLNQISIQSSDNSERVHNESAHPIPGIIYYFFLSYQ